MVRGGLGKIGLPQHAPGIQHGLCFGREFFCFVIPANAGIQYFLGLDLLGLLASVSNFVLIPA
jgi:hypothetical protein